MDGYELLTQLLFGVEYQRADTYQYHGIFGNNRYSFLACCIGMHTNHQFKKAPSNRGLRHTSALPDTRALKFKKAPSNRGLRHHARDVVVNNFPIQKSPIKSGIKTEMLDIFFG